MTGEDDPVDPADNNALPPRAQQAEESLTQWMRRELSRIPRDQLHRVKVRVVDLVPEDDPTPTTDQ